MSDAPDLMAQLEACLGGEMMKAFEEAAAETGSIYDLPPDGEYQALINLFEFFNKTDWIGLKVSYQVTNHPTYSGRICGDLMTISVERIGWIKGWLAKMEVPVEDPAVLLELRPGSDLLNRLLDTPVMIKVKRSPKKDGSGVYENVYLLQKIGEYGSGAAAGNGFTPHAISDVTNPQDGFDFAPQGVGAINNDDDIPF